MMIDEIAFGMRSLTAAGNVALCAPSPSPEKTVTILPGLNDPRFVGVVTATDEYVAAMRSAAGKIRQSGTGK